MAIDSMNKVIHAAVRRDFARLAAALDDAPDGDRKRAADLRRAWVQLHKQLRRHHDHEETLLWPALLQLGVDSSLVDFLGGEHAAMIAALDGIDVAMRAYAGSGSAADASAAAEVVASGAEVVERHFAHEEGELEPAMAPYLEDPVWKQAEGQVRKQSPLAIGEFFAWLQDGASPEVTAYLGATIPAPVRAVLVLLFGRGYRARIAPVWA